MQRVSGRRGWGRNRISSFICATITPASFALPLPMHARDSTSYRASPFRSASRASFTAPAPAPALELSAFLALSLRSALEREGEAEGEAEGEVEGEVEGEREDSLRLLFGEDKGEEDGEEGAPSMMLRLASTHRSTWMYV